MIDFLKIAILVIIAIALLKLMIKHVIIFEYEQGLKYEQGKFKEILGPGQYFIPFSSNIEKVDMRLRFASVTGQEVLSSDGITLKVSLAAKYQIIDPVLAINKIQNYQESLHLELQLALREIIGTSNIETLLEKRNEFSTQLKELTEKKIEALGIQLVSVNIKDIMFPGSLKEIFSQVVKARQEGLAALEKARGETAALRNLANAAKMLESNPNLMQLRLIQAFGESSGNTLCLGVPLQTESIILSDIKSTNK